MDPFEGVERYPLTLHKYLYAGADPANKVDPTGEFLDVGSQLTALQISTQTRTQSVVQYSTTVRTVAATLLAAGFVTSAVGVFDVGPGGGNRGNHWELHRNLTDVNPVVNFMSNAALGEPRRGPEVHNDFIYEGVSTWSSLRAARAKVPVIERGGKKTVWGIAELRIPVNAPDVFVLNTFSSEHYTLRGAPESIFRYWRATSPPR